MWIINKHLMTDPKENSEFCFAETLNVSRGKAEGNVEDETSRPSLCWLAHKFTVVSRSMN